MLVWNAPLLPRVKIVRRGATCNVIRKRGQKPAINCILLRPRTPRSCFRCQTKQVAFAMLLVAVSKVFSADSHPRKAVIDEFVLDGVGEGDGDQLVVGVVVEALFAIPNQV